MQGSTKALKTCPAVVCGEDYEHICLADKQSHIYGSAIEITDAMVQAGVDEARSHLLGQDLGDLVRQVFIAMKVEELEG